MRIAIGIPAYDGQLHIETARSLINEHTAAASMGVELQVLFVSGCSLITYARNQLVRTFLNTDCEKLVFLDSDVSFEPGSLIKLASHPVDVVGGAYRYKNEPEGYPVIWLKKDELWSSALGLLEVESLPGGFLAISRGALETLRNHFPDRSYSHLGESFWAYFHAGWSDELKTLYGEDAAFCADFRAAGGQVWLDPELSLTHHDGKQKFAGHIGNWLKSRIPQ